MSDDPIASRTRSGTRPDSGKESDLFQMDQLALAAQVAEGETLPDVPGSVEDMMIQVEEAIIGQVTNIEAGNAYIYMYVCILYIYIYLYILLLTLCLLRTQDIGIRINIFKLLNF